MKAPLRQMDQRWTFALVAVAIAFALFAPVEQPIKPDKPVIRVHDFIEKLPEGSAVMLAVDFDPQAKAELVPITIAILKHCLRQNLRVIGMTFWPEGAALGQQMFSTITEDAEFQDKQVGRDFVYLGYKPGGMPQVITNMGENILGTFPQDYQNRPTTTMPIFQDVKSLKDIDYLIDLAAGGTPDAWIIYGSDKYGVAMAVGCTAVVGPDLYVRLNAGQINGLVAGLRGAADYEALLEEPGLGMGGMFAQSIVHAMIILFVIVGNIAFLRSRRRRIEQG